MVSEFTLTPLLEVQKTHDQTTGKPVYERVSDSLPAYSDRRKKLGWYFHLLQVQLLSYLLPLLWAMECRPYRLDVLASLLDGWAGFLPHVFLWAGKVTFYLLGPLQMWDVRCEEIGTRQCLEELSCTTNNVP